MRHRTPNRIRSHAGDHLEERTLLAGESLGAEVPNDLQAASSLSIVDDSASLVIAQNPSRQPSMESSKEKQNSTEKLPRVETSQDRSVSPSPIVAPSEVLPPAEVIAKSETAVESENDSNREFVTSGGDNDTPATSTGDAVDATPASENPHIAGEPNSALDVKPSELNFQINSQAGADILPSPLPQTEVPVLPQEDRSSPEEDSSSSEKNSAIEFGQSASLQTSTDLFNSSSAGSSSGGSGVSNSPAANDPPSSSPMDSPASEIAGIGGRGASKVLASLTTGAKTFLASSSLGDPEPLTLTGTKDAPKVVEKTARPSDPVEPRRSGEEALIELRPIDPAEAKDQPADARAASTGSQVESPSVAESSSSDKDFDDKPFEIKPLGEARMTTDQKPQLELDLPAISTSKALDSTVPSKASEGPVKELPTPIDAKPQGVPTNNGARGESNPEPKLESSSEQFDTQAKLASEILDTKAEAETPSLPAPAKSNGNGIGNAYGLNKGNGPKASVVTAIKPTVNLEPVAKVSAPENTGMVELVSLPRVKAPVAVEPVKLTAINEISPAKVQTKTVSNDDASVSALRTSNSSAMLTESTKPVAGVGSLATGVTPPNIASNSGLPIVSSSLRAGGRQPALVSTSPFSERLAFQFSETRLVRQSASEYSLKIVSMPVVPAPVNWLGMMLLSGEHVPESPDFSFRQESESEERDPAKVKNNADETPADVTPEENEQTEPENEKPPQAESEATLEQIVEFKTDSFELSQANTRLNPAVADREATAASPAETATVDSDQPYLKSSIGTLLLGLIAFAWPSKRSQGQLSESTRNH